MNPESAINLTRLGLICDFLAFFLAAPELLGEKGMRTVQKYIRYLMIILSFVLFAVSLLGVVLLLFFWLFIPILIMISSAAALVLLSDYQAITDLASLPEPQVSPNDIIYYYFAFGALGGFLSWFPSKLMKIVDELSSNGRFRRQLLNLGVLLFVFGAIAQLAGFNSLLFASLLLHLNFTAKDTGAIIGQKHH